ncbi:Importin beta-like protein [Colletotrichum gloeosporioides]|uniref:Importin beta-like protein n=1 Tax=Colletotrichum gloeosporioides TaxID=474922 RepID=A0A8H8WN30_COLGL|nr:Importin beta-like protein [Colletotrichum gloeosporioides]KAF3796946.1 Importin beta-like protein [Colletotrichum gloeosporioides]
MDGRLPTTIQEAEALVLALYEPAPPETITRIQEVLHRLQRSPSGWWIARDLLSHNDDKVKFFGALTLIVKLNTERYIPIPLTSKRHSWVWFSQRVSSQNDELVASLRTLIQPTIVALGDEDLYEVAVELLADVLSNYSVFLTESHYESLFSLFETQWSDERYRRLVKGDFDFDSIQYGQLMISLGDSKVQSLIHSVDNRSSNFLARLRGLLSAQGYPVSEDKIFVPALEFWSTYVETLTDCIYSDSDSKAWVSSATSHVLEAVSTIWRRVAYPPPSVLASWDSADRAGFGDARKDVADLLQSTFTVTGPPLISTFANLTLQSMSPNSWPDLEAAAFCLGSLAECVSGDAGCDDTLRAVFSSPLFELLQASREIMPGRTRQTCISLIERYSDYFERESQSLPAALTLLFSVLNDPHLAGSAARSIQRLCFSSRSVLAPEASAFLGQYQSIASQGQLDCLASERILGAIAAVIQAVSPDDERLDRLEVLLSFVEYDARRAIHLLSMPLGSPEVQGECDTHRCSALSELSEFPLHIALKSLRGLISIGKGLQAPGDLPLDLDSEREHTFVDQGSRLGQIQSRIMSVVVELQASFPRSGEVAESICNIFKTGFSESETGPFVFPPQLICDYLAQQASDVPRIGLFVSTACSFLSSLRNLKRNDVEDIRTKLLRWVIGLLQQLPENDTELAQNGIEFTNRLVSREPTALFRPECLPLAEYFFVYALRATFVSLKDPDKGAQATIDHAVAQLGPMIAQSIVQNIGGNASRSELDRLGEPLKRMVSNQVKARAWLEQALFDPSFPGQHISSEEKAVFLKKIIKSVLFFDNVSLRMNHNH